MLIEGLAVFVFYDLVFLACLMFMGILEHFEKVQARKRAKARRKSKVQMAKLEYLKMIS